MVQMKRQKTFPPGTGRFVSAVSWTHRDTHEEENLENDTLGKK